VALNQENVAYFCTVKGIINFGHDFSYIRESHQPPRELRFVNNRMLFIVLRHCWCVIFLKAYGPAGDKSDDSDDTFCEELQQVFDQFPK